MDPIVAVYEITFTIRAPEGNEVEAPLVAELEAAAESGVETLLRASGGHADSATVNAIAKRTDR